MSRYALLIFPLADTGARRAWEPRPHRRSSEASDFLSLRFTKPVYS